MQIKAKAERGSDKELTVDYPVPATVAECVAKWGEAVIYRFVQAGIASLVGRVIRVGLSEKIAEDVIVANALAVNPGETRTRGKSDNFAKFVQKIESGEEPITAERIAQLQATLKAMKIKLAETQQAA